MVVSNVYCNLAELFIINATQNLMHYNCTLRRVFFHFFIFFRSKLSGLTKNGVVYGNFSQVVHRGSLYQHS